MKNFKALAWILPLLVVSFGIIAMEPAYKPKVYISNHNTTSLIGASIGIKCIINGISPNLQGSDGMAFFVPAGQDKAIGQLGADSGTDIVSLDLQPSSAGAGYLSGLGKATVYPLTDHLNKMLCDLDLYPNQDIVIVVNNNTLSGYWQFEFLWRERLSEEAMPIHEVAKEQLKRPAPTHKPAKQIGKKREMIKIETVTKPIQGQGNGSMWQAITSPNVQDEMKAVLQRRKAALECK